MPPSYLAPFRKTVLMEPLSLQETQKGVRHGLEPTRLCTRRLDRLPPTFSPHLPLLLHQACENPTLRLQLRTLPALFQSNDRRTQPQRRYPKNSLTCRSPAAVRDRCPGVPAAGESGGLLQCLPPL